MARRVLLVLLSLVLLVVLAAGGAVAWLLLRPNDLKGPLTRLASDRLGVPVRVEGPLRLGLGRVATVRLEGLRVGAPEWAAAENLAEVNALRLGIDLPASLRAGTAVLTELSLTRPRLALERDAQGRTSWPDLGGRDEGDDTDQGGAAPRLGALEIEEGRVAYRDAAARVDVETRVDTTPPPPGGGLGGLTLDGTGRLDGRDLGFTLEVGSPLALQARAAGEAVPFPVKGRLTLPGTTANLDGSLSDPLALGGLALDIALDSPEPAQLLALLLGRADAALPPGLALKGRLERAGAGEAFALTGVEATWGESRLAGEASYRPAPSGDGGGKPRLEARLTSPLLDLRPFAEASLGTAPPAADEPQAAPVPPDGAPPTAALAGYDGRLALDLAEVRLPGAAGQTLREVGLEASLEGGRLASRRCGSPRPAAGWRAGSRPAPWTGRRSRPRSSSPRTASTWRRCWSRPSSRRSGGWPAGSRAGSRAPCAAPRPPRSWPAARSPSRAGWTRRPSPGWRCAGSRPRPGSPTAGSRSTRSRSTRPRAGWPAGSRPRASAPTRPRRPGARGRGAGPGAAAHPGGAGAGRGRAGGAVHGEARRHLRGAAPADLLRRSAVTLDGRLEVPATPGPTSAGRPSPPGSPTAGWRSTRCARRCRRAGSRAGPPSPASPRCWPGEGRAAPPRRARSTSGPRRSTSPPCWDPTPGSRAW
jgi:hypothetical protein